MTDPHRGAYTCASYITVSLDKMEKMSGSISGSVLHQCATLTECVGELNLANLMFRNTVKLKERVLKREAGEKEIGKYDKCKLKVNLAVVGQSS